MNSMNFPFCWTHFMPNDDDDKAKRERIMPKMMSKMSIEQRVSLAPLYCSLAHLAVRECPQFPLFSVFFLLPHLLSCTGYYVVSFYCIADLLLTHPTR